MNKGKCMGLFVAGVLLSGQLVFAGDITVQKGERVLSFDTPPRIVGGRVQVPFRGIFEELGYTVSWEADTGTVTGTKEGTELSFVVGDTCARVNQTEVALDAPVEIVQGRAYVPLRLVAEASGYVVDWEEENRQVVLTAPQDVELPFQFDFQTQDVSRLAAYIQTQWEEDFQLEDYALTVKRVVENGEPVEDGTLWLVYTINGFETEHQFISQVRNGQIESVRMEGKKPENVSFIIDAGYESQIVQRALDECRANLERGWAVKETTVWKRFDTEPYYVVQVLLTGDNGEEMPLAFTYRPICEEVTNS